MKSRTQWQVTRDVWHAIFLREASVRVAGDRYAWFWMLFEPVAIIAIMVAIRSVVRTGMSMSGVDHIPWLVIGLLGFYLFRENMNRSIGAIDANRAMLAYRQVKPIDPVLVRCYVEGLLKTFILVLFILAGTLVELDLVPDEPMQALFFWGSLWMLGLAFGLAVSALSTIIEEIGKLTRIVTIPLFLISGVILPIASVPDQYRMLLMINPVAHGLELLRGAFFEHYHVVPEADIVYLWFWILAWMLLGLLLHVRYQQRLVAV